MRGVFSQTNFHGSLSLKLLIVTTIMFLSGCGSRGAWLVTKPGSVAPKQPYGPVNPRHPRYGTVELDFYFRDRLLARERAYKIMYDTCDGAYEIIKDPYSGIDPWRPVNPHRYTSTIEGPNLFIDFDCVGPNYQSDRRYGILWR